MNKQVKANELCITFATYTYIQLAQHAQIQLRFLHFRFLRAIQISINLFNTSTQTMYALSLMNV